MNPEADTLNAAIQAVEKHARIVLQPRHSYPARAERLHADGIAEIQFQGGTLSQPYEVKRVLNTATMQMLAILRRESKAGLLLVAPHVNGPQADRLRDADIHFIDAAGNVFLKKGRAYVLVTGRKPASPTSVSERSRAFQASGLKLIFGLLTDPHLDVQSRAPSLVSRPYRQIGAATGLPHSTIGWVMPDLIRQGYVIAVDKNTRLLVERRQLLERWVVAYGERLRPGLVAGRFQPPTAAWWKEAVLRSGLWSGEVAAAILTGYLKPGTSAIFALTPGNDFILRHGLRIDPQGDVEFLKPFWQEPPLWEPEKNCVHPLLVYADLLAIDDDRTRETAQVIYDQHLRPIIEAA
ncbi:MAG: type IV toxin-antitoxin system AbiEi family antitoxin [Verrucomicrobia bacterium]|nr:type IV toxin-antitoxin system AbiEi family antitoxin [Verrucomicrobiota bacterium]